MKRRSYSIWCKLWGPKAITGGLFAVALTIPPATVLGNPILKTNSEQSLDAPLYSAEQPNAFREKYYIPPQRLFPEEENICVERENKHTFLPEGADTTMEAFKNSTSSRPGPEDSQGKAKEEEVPTAALRRTLRRIVEPVQQLLREEVFARLQVEHTTKALNERKEVKD